MSKWYRCKIDNRDVRDGSHNIVASCKTFAAAKAIAIEHNAHEALLGACSNAADLFVAIPEIPNHEGSALSMVHQLRQAIALAGETP